MHEEQSSRMAAVRPSMRAPLPMQPSRRAWQLPDLVTVIASAFFFLLLFTPTVYRPVKGALLALCLLLVAMRTLTSRRLRAHPSVVGWTVVMILVGLFFIGLGAINGAPGAVRVSTVYVIWPAVYLLLIAGLANRDLLVTMLRVHLVSATAIALYGLSFIFYERGWIPGFLYIRLNLGQQIGFYRGYTEVNLYSLSTLIFQVPFLLAALMVWPRRLAAELPRIWLWVSLSLCALLVLLSGRRGLMAAVAVGPLFTLALGLFLPVDQRVELRVQLRRFAIGSVLVLSILAVYLTSVHGYDPGAFVDMFLAGFAFDDDYGLTGAAVRREQFRSLMTGWMASPLFGAGHGSFYAAASVRMSDAPWSYELYYVALLYQTGVVGLLAYSSGVAWIYYKGIQMIRSGSDMGRRILPILVGMTSFLLANGTNPYLGKFDYLWIIFLPVAYINFWLLNGGDRKRGR